MIMYKITNVTIMGVTIEDLGITLQPNEFKVVGSSAVEKSADLEKYGRWVKVEPVVIPKKGPPNPVRIFAPNIPVAHSQPAPPVVSPPVVSPPSDPSVDSLKQSVDSLKQSVGASNQHLQDKIDSMALMISKLMSSGIRTTAVASSGADSSFDPLPMVLPGNIVPKDGDVEARVKTTEENVEVKDFDRTQKALRKRKSPRKSPEEKR